MKRTLALLLASLLVVFGLTACGCSAKDAGTTQNGNATTNNGMTDNGQTGNGTNGNGQSGNGASGNGQTNGNNGKNDNNHEGGIFSETGDMIQEGVDDVENAITGNDTRNRNSDATYGDMLDNGRVNDQDGILTDNNKRR